CSRTARSPQRKSAPRRKARSKNGSSPPADGGAHSETRRRTFGSAFLSLSPGGEERAMAKLNANGIFLEYETFGAASDPAVVLIAGLGFQLIDWPVAFCEKIAKAGFYVIRFDNRDI